MCQKNLPFRFSAVYFSLFLILFSSSVLAQQAKITIRCIDETEITDSEKQKDKKTEKTQSKKQLPRFKLDEKIEKNEENLGEETNILPINCESLAVITVFPGGPPNTTLNYTVTQNNPANIVRLKRFSQDPYTTSVVIPVTLDSNGAGQSAPFFVKGLILGETILIGTTPTYVDTTPLNITVVECKCPVIPVNTPPRN